MVVVTPEEEPPKTVQSKLGTHLLFSHMQFGARSAAGSLLQEGRFWRTAVQSPSEGKEEQTVSGKLQIACPTLKKVWSQTRVPQQSALLLQKVPVWYRFIQFGLDWLAVPSMSQTKVPSPQVVQAVLSEGWHQEETSQSL